MACPKCDYPHGSKTFCPMCNLVKYIDTQRRAWRSRVRRSHIPIFFATVTPSSPYDYREPKDRERHDIEGFFCDYSEHVLEDGTKIIKVIASARNELQILLADGNQAINFTSFFVSISLTVFELVIGKVLTLFDAIMTVVPV